MQRFTKCIMAAAVVCSLFVTEKSSAQAQLGIYGAGFFPMGEFNSKGYTNGGGGGFTVLSPNLAGTDESKFILQAGAGMDGGYFGRRKFIVDLQEPANTKGNVYIYNSTIALTGYLRPSVVIGRWQPFAQIFGGARWFTTDQRIVPLNANGQENPEGETRDGLLSNGAFTYGFGFGTMYRLSDIVSVEMGVDFSMGGRTRFAVLNGIQQPENEIDLKASYQNSRTDMLIVKLGLQFNLVSCSSDDFEERGSSGSENSSAPSYTPPSSKSQPRNIIKPNPPKPNY